MIQRLMAGFCAASACLSLAGIAGCGSDSGGGSTSAQGFKVPNEPMVTSVVRLRLVVLTPPAALARPPVAARMFGPLLSGSAAFV